MAAGVRAVFDAAALIDVVIEVRDARVPRSTDVASLHPRLKTKPALVLLNRKDLADSAATHAWLASLANSGVAAFSTVGKSAVTLKPVRSALVQMPRRRAKLRAAVIGAPNTGKSSVINSLARRHKAIAANKPGVTRETRWIAVSEHADLLDTPGVLEPKITNPTAAWQLALCGVLPESAFDPEEVVGHFHSWLGRHRPELAAATDLDVFARTHGMLRRGGELDRRNAARAMIAAFRAGKLGHVTFEQPKDIR